MPVSITDMHTVFLDWICSILRVIPPLVVNLRALEHKLNSTCFTRILSALIYKGH